MQCVFLFHLCHPVKVELHAAAAVSRADVPLPGGVSCQEALTAAVFQVDDNKKLGEWVGLCKIDREGKPRKVVGCSCVVVKVRDALVSTGTDGNGTFRSAVTPSKCRGMSLVPCHRLSLGYMTARVRAPPSIWGLGSQRMATGNISGQIVVPRSCWSAGRHLLPVTCSTCFLSAGLRQRISGQGCD